jgi:hypothetical protein
VWRENKVFLNYPAQWKEQRRERGNEPTSERYFQRLDVWIAQRTRTTKSGGAALVPSPPSGQLTDQLRPVLPFSLTRSSLFHSSLFHSSLFHSSLFHSSLFHSSLDPHPPLPSTRPKPTPPFLASTKRSAQAPRTTLDASAPPVYTPPERCTQYARAIACFSPSVRIGRGIYVCTRSLHASSSSLCALLPPALTRPVPARPSLPPTPSSLRTGKDGPTRLNQRLTTRITIKPIDA